MTHELTIKKGDLVRVVRGSDKGVEGRVIAVRAADRRVIVEGVNRVKKHTRIRTTQRGAKTGGIVTQEAAIHVSNVMLVVEVDGDKVPTRIGFRRDEVDKTRPDGTTYAALRSVRVAKRTGKEI